MCACSIMYFALKAVREHFSVNRKRKKRQKTKVWQGLGIIRISVDETSD